MGMVAHEFRTPLAILQAALENLRLCPNGDAGSRLDRMQRATARLVQLTDNCLADARLSSRDLHAVAGYSAAAGHLYGRDGRGSFANHYLDVTLEGQTEVGLPLHRCCLLMAGYCIAIANLLDNSVKYAFREISIEIYPQEKRGITRWRSRSSIPPDRVEHSSAIGAAKRILQRRRDRAWPCVARQSSGSRRGLWLAENTSAGCKCAHAPG